jgi:hypothetical protein
LTNNEIIEPFVEYYFNTITSIDDVNNSFNDVVKHERDVNNSFKIIHDYGRIIEEIDRVDNHDNITNTHSAPLIVDSGLHYIPTIINLNLPKTLDVNKEYLNMSIIQMCNNINLDTKHRIIGLYNVVFKKVKFKTTIGR